MPPARFSWFDGLLAVLALVGVLLLTVVLPRTHVDAAASYTLTEDGALAAAEDLLRAHGFEPAGLERTVLLVRDPALLDTLQRAEGREGARALLQAERRLPAFYWRTAWRGADSSETIPDAHYRVHLTADGAPFSLTVYTDATRPAGLNRRTLAAAFGRDSARPLDVPLDSLRADDLVFDLTEEPVRIDPALRDSMQQVGRADLAREARLSAYAAVELAEVYRAGSLLGTLAMRPVTAELARGGGALRVARVRFVGTEPVGGLVPVGEVSVTAAGHLDGFQLAYGVAPDTPLHPTGPDEGLLTFGGGLESLPGLVRIGFLLLLLLIVLVLFGRRLAARAIDARAAIVDAGLMFASVVVWALPVYVLLYRQEAGFPLVESSLLALLGVVVWGGTLSALVFLAAATSDSVARSVWPRKIDALTMVRGGAWLNRPVGTALIRGALLGAALAGVPVVMWWVTGARVDIGAPPNNVGAYAPSAALYAFPVYLGTALLVLHVGVFGLASLLARLGRSGAPGEVRTRALVVGGLTLAGALALVGPAARTVEPAGLAWVFAGVYSAVLALVAWRYDGLTTFWTVLLSFGLYTFAVAALGEANPAQVEWVLVALGFATLLGLGALGLRLDRTGRAVQRVEPTYVTEIAARERLEREVEIAREVQRSFLPTSMPEVPGLDLAATCVPAEEVGGDYYDLITLGDRTLAVVVGDVSGKGIQAAFYMSLVKGFVRALCGEHASPAAVLRRVNRLFCDNVPTGAFISMIYGVFDLEARTFTFARAGHNPLILKRAGHSRADLLQPSGLAIGLSKDHLFDDVLVDHTIDLLPGDTLVFYTDGFTEAVDEARKLYGDARLAVGTAEAMREVADRSAAQLLGTLVADVRAFAAADGLRDDMTMVVVRIAPPQPDEQEARTASVAQV